MCKFCLVSITGFIPCSKGASLRQSIAIQRRHTQSKILADGSAHPRRPSEHRFDGNVWPAGHTTVEVAGSRVNLGEVPLSANYEISFKMTVHAFYPGDTNGADLVTIVHLSGRRRGL